MNANELKLETMDSSPSSSLSSFPWQKLKKSHRDLRKKASSWWRRPLKSELGRPLNFRWMVKALENGDYMTKIDWLNPSRQSWSCPALHYSSSFSPYKVLTEIFFLFSFLLSHFHCPDSTQFPPYRSHSTAIVFTGLVFENGGGESRNVATLFCLHIEKFMN